MAITKSDCLILLTNLGNEGIGTQKYISQLVRAKDPPIEVIKFINDNRNLDLTNFYIKLRKSYNNKKSNLYINIVKENQNDIITILNSLALQIILFSKTVKNVQIFYRQARLEEIYKCLLNYSQTYDLIPCLKLLNLIKADLCVCEALIGKREL